MYIRVNHHPDHLAISRIHGRRDTMLADGDTEFDHKGEVTKVLADSAGMRGYDCVAFSSRFMLVASLQTLLESSQPPHGWRRHEEIRIMRPGYRIMRPG